MQKGLARARANQKKTVKGRALDDSPANEKKEKYAREELDRLDKRMRETEKERSSRKPVSEPSKRLAARGRTDAGRQTDATIHYVLYHPTAHFFPLCIER